MEKYYKILEIPPNATEQEVKQAYRDLVKVWHPDRFTHDIKLQKRAENKLKEINLAYQQIIDHLNNSKSDNKPNQYRRTENQEKANSQPPPKQPYNSWICPACLRTNYMDTLSCSCGFKTNVVEIETYKANRTSADLYNAILFNRTMNYTERANFLARYLLTRFPDSKEADFIKHSTQSTTSPRQGKTKSTKLWHLKKNWGWYLVLGLIGFVIIINSALNPAPASKRTTTLNEAPQQVQPTPNTEPYEEPFVSDYSPPTPPFVIKEPIFAEPIQPMPINGAIERYVPDEAICPLKIVTRESGQHCFVKITDWYTGDLILTVFIRSEQSISVDVPLGSYKLRYATGEQWYGTEFLFGPETAYYEADKKLDFEIRGNHVSGYTVKLFLQPHGNLRTKKISAEQF